MLIILDTQPTDIWHDPLVLTVAGVIATLLAGFIGAFVAYWIFLKQRTKKEITYQVLTDAAIANLNQRIANINIQVKDRLQIFFDGKPVEDLRLMILKVWNSGNVDVRVWNSRQKDVKNEEYEVPIRFEFEGRKVVSIAGIETEPIDDVIEPKDLKIYLTQESKSTSETDFVELPHCLLKPNQSINLTLWLTGLQGSTIRRGKLLDGIIKEFNPATDGLKKRRINFIAIPAIVLIISLLLIGLFYFNLNMQTNPFLTILITMLIILNLLAYFYLRYRK